MIVDERPMELFNRLLDEALELTGLDVDEEVSFYVCRLLVDMGERTLDEGPFGVRLLSSSEPVVLRSVGDGTLFLSGFFPERISRLGLSTSYMEHVGSSAYTALAGRVPGQVAGMYRTMAHTFPRLRNALEVVRDGCDAPAIGKDGLALRWLQNRSEGLRRRLITMGVDVSGIVWA